MLFLDEAVMNCSLLANKEGMYRRAPPTKKTGNVALVEYNIFLLNKTQNGKNEMAKRF